MPVRVLAISVSGIGNCLMLTPALAALKRRQPDALIDVLVEGRGAKDLLERNPHVNKVYCLGYERSRTAALRAALRLRGKGYDTSLTAFPSNKASFRLLSLAIGARTRIGHTYPECGHFPLDCAYTTRVEARRGVHDIRQNLALVTNEQAPAPTTPRPILHLSEVDHAFAADYLGSRGLGEPLVAVHPGSGCHAGRRQDAKRWPVRRFCELMEALVRSGASTLVFCGPAEQELGRRMQSFAKERRLARVDFPRASLLGVAALIARATCLVSNDSGLMHMATAVHTPVVALFGPTNPERTAPPWTDCTVLSGDPCPCRPCLRYPFETRCSELGCERPVCWRGLSAQKVSDALWAVPRREGHLPLRSEVAHG